MLHLKGSGGVSAAYILPKAHVPKNPSDLAGSRVWMVLRGFRGDVLFASIYVDVIERFEDGLNQGDLLLTVDPARSYRCASSYTSAVSSFHCEKTSLLPMGMSEANDSLYEELTEQAGAKVQVKLQMPPKSMLGDILVPSSKGSNRALSERILAATTRRLSLEEVWASGQNPKLPPFANFAYRRFVSMRGEEAAREMLTFFIEADPMIHKFIQPSVKGRPAAQRSSRPVVDVNLRPVDPDKIYARRFIARSRDLFDIADAMDKTEHAEKRHQDMLRDIATRLKKLDFEPLQSSSIDLLVETNRGYAMFELKTTTPKNILGQAAKGVFQLGCYKAALADQGYQDNKISLIIETTLFLEIDSYVSQIVESFGVTPLFYDGKKPWPRRVDGLMEVINDGPY
ncbi:MAG: hypothetical protein OEZ32_03345 [Nitrospinota bacterium]|nr:hypothetical protein [Nitrospinota bacterium]